MELIRIIFTEADVESFAEEAGVDKETAMKRAESWAKHIQDTATSIANEQLASAVQTDNV